VPALYRSIVVPVNGGATDFHVIDLAIALASTGTGTDLTLVYVVEVPQQYPLDADLPDEIRRGEAVMGRAEEYAHLHGHGIWGALTAALLQARFAAAAIVDELIERNSDAIILATRNEYRLGLLTQGETVPYVLDNAPCDVLVLRVAGDGEVE
jgi:nucleotide-binding universal stress UspA family protein